MKNLPKISKSLKVNTDSYKIGMNEVEGMREAIFGAFRPIIEELMDKIYWNEDIVSEIEYRGRDGFIPYAHNCGGIEVVSVVPKCEGYDFPFLEFGECEECSGEEQCGYEGMECGYESEGYLDACFRLIFKFEGFNEEGKMQFYVNLSGGNSDAPYFRYERLPDIFESDLTCKDFRELKSKAKKINRKLLEIIKGEK